VILSQGEKSILNSRLEGVDLRAILKEGIQDHVVLTQASL